MEKYIQIGKIAAIFGLKGDLIVSHRLGARANWNHIPVLFIEKNRNSYIPYFLEAVYPKSETEARIKLEEVDSKETARSLLRKNISLESSVFREVVGPDSDLSYLGFTLFDKKEKELGEIAELIELPEQLLAKVFQKGSELLIPLSPQTIEQIDKDKKIIYVALPDGLLDLYRNL